MSSTERHEPPVIAANSTIAAAQLIDWCSHWLSVFRKNLFDSGREVRDVEEEFLICVPKQAVIHDLARAIDSKK